MIDYSVYMMPNPSKPDAAPKAYARAQVKEVVSLDKFVKHLSEHNGVFTRGSIKGIITDLTECLIEYMLNGYKVTLGDLGSFCPSLSSTGAESIKDFTSHSITAVNIIFTPGEGFENLITRAEFNPVSSRAAQVATYKAERAGETTVDLEAAKKKPETGNGEGEENETPTDPVTPPTGGGGTDPGDEDDGGLAG